MAAVWFAFMMLVLFVWNAWLKRGGGMRRLNHSTLIVVAIGIVSLAACLAIQVSMKAGA